MVADGLLVVFIASFYLSLLAQNRDSAMLTKKWLHFVCVFTAELCVDLNSEIRLIPRVNAGVALNSHC